MKREVEEFMKELAGACFEVAIRTCIACLTTWIERVARMLKSSGKQVFCSEEDPLKEEIAARISKDGAWRSLETIGQYLCWKKQT